MDIFPVMSFLRGLLGLLEVNAYLIVNHLNILLLAYDNNKEEKKHDQDLIKKVLLLILAYHFHQN